MNLSVVVPNYNGQELLKKNLPKLLESLESYSKGFIELLITDDASTDLSTEIIEKFINENKDSGVKIVLLKSDKNKGFSSSVNRGVNRAKGEIIVLLNTDVSPHKNFLGPLIENFENKNIFAVGCMDESLENGKIILRGRGVGKWRRGFLVHRAGQLDKKDTLWANGGSSAFRKDIWDKLGGMDTIYDPFYWDDIDLSYRARKSGYDILFERDSIVRHEHESGAIKKEYSASSIKKIAYRNQIIFVWKNSDFNTLISHVFWLPYHLIKTLAGRDLAFLSGLISAISLIPKIITSRSRARKLFNKSDSEVVRIFV